MNQKHGMALWLGGVMTLNLGCGPLQDLFNQVASADYDIPVTQESPEMTVDVGTQITRMEDQLAAKQGQTPEDTQRYKILVALCKTEPGKSCEPTARFPARIPRYVWPAGCFDTTANPPTFLPAEQCTAPMTCQETDPTTLENGFNPLNPPAGNGCVDVNKWMAALPDLADYTTVAQAVKFDLSTQGSLKDIPQVKKVTVTAVTLHFKENSYTQAIPTTETFAGAPVSDAEAQDAKALITANRISKFGTLASVPAQYTGARDLTLDADGKTKLSDAIKGFKATLAGRAHVTLPPDTEANRADNCRDPAHLSTGVDYCESFAKPDGRIKFTVEVSVTFTVNAKG